MTAVAEGGAAFAWRLLATLEGGTLLLAIGSALIAFTARRRAKKRKRGRKGNVRNVLISNTESILGKELKTQLESRGCVVNTVTEELLSGATSAADKVDALVVIGAQPRTECLNGMAEFVSEDVYNNLKLLESLSNLVRPGGCIAWACAGEEAGTGAFSVVGAAFDAVIQASLKHIAKSSRCEDIWIDRSEGAQKTAERLTAALVPSDDPIDIPRFSFRLALLKIGEYLGRWLKIVT